MKTASLTLIGLCLAAAPSALAAGYAVNYPDGTTITNGGRTLNSVKLNSPADGAQSIESSQATDRALYHDRTQYCFSAAAGETVSVTFDWSGTWMHGYVYLDCDNDGEFDAADGSARDVMAFSNFDGVNSAGTVTSNGNVGVNPPSFKVPDLEPGLYRMRFKIDWNSIDPAGRTGDNLITTNGGAITDAMIYIHKPGGSFKADSHGGKLTDASGKELTAASVTPGSALTVFPVADEGYAFDALTVASGYDCGSASVTFANPGLSHSERTIPAFAMKNGSLTIPATMLCGDVSISASFLPSKASGEGNYEFDGGDTAKDPARGITAIHAAGQTIEVASARSHCFMSNKAIGVIAGEPFTLTADYSGSAAPLRLWLDHGQDGVFAEVEGAISSDLLGTIGGESKFTVNAMLPNGVYRARVEAPGDCAVDFLVNVHSAEGKLDVKAMNGNVVASDGGALPLTVTYGTAFTVKPMEVLTGYSAKQIIVRHGQNLDGPAYIHGNRQWQDTPVAIGTNMTPVKADLVDGDVDIYVIFEEQANSQWTKVWGDEFNGNAIDGDRWQYQQRMNATWNRLTAQGEEIPLVNVVEDGHYKAYCIPTPTQFKPAETQDMISGALNSAGLFHFTYGRVEARIKTNRHTGNFPAFWMMPQQQPLGWPKDGEIDIWEQIDDAQPAYHTIHSGWTYKSFGDVARNTPQSSGNEWIDHDLWHVYALEWDAEELRWYVDGQQKFSYTNQHYSDGGSYTEQITWPFYKDFYIIINQSVGNGSWAKWCDTDYTYLTEFDWVRVYKRKGDDGYTTKINHNGDDPDFYVEAEEDPNSEITDVTLTDTDAPAPAQYFDLRGIRVDAPSAPGLYIERRGATATKILKH